MLYNLGRVEISHRQDVDKIDTLIKKQAPIYSRGLSGSACGRYNLNVTSQNIASQAKLCNDFVGSRG